MVCAGLVGGDGGDVVCGGVVLQVVVEKRAQDVLPEPGPGVAAEANRAQAVGGLDLLPVMPGAEDEEDLVVVLVEGLDGLVDGERAVDVFLIPEAVDQHDGNLDAFFGESAASTLSMACSHQNAVVAGVREDLAPEAHLLEAVLFAEFAGRAGAHVQVVVVEGGGPPLGVLLRTSRVPSCS